MLSTLLEKLQMGVLKIVLIRMIHLVGFFLASTFLSFPC